LGEPLRMEASAGLSFEAVARATAPQDDGGESFGFRNAGVMTVRLV
jgi:hypothetical protein